MIYWKCKPFRDLTVFELYAILRLRSEIFVVEQNCVFLDMDNKDQHCYHLCGWDGDVPAAYVRLVPPGISYTEPSIGRVVTNAGYRKSGTGRVLMQKAIEHCGLLFGKTRIKIGAQLYLKKFYESLGFVQCSDIYLEDDIEHIEMIFEPVE
ncbi:GNAT family N-acetyltransferase [Panacibacter ginsenosidivorans]|uniref:GNAT family N-acetyltransferase n=1 Tax=Panacibacter ginsenosidivorans TaxID=1813871 RepID=A0A5B8V3B3_9BACT|nr:GNAT family N-acetyltransferase [Panacibacter ginsenosidivorans]QEC66007.1 GNAT family N-acetyltransferase [Panacibacter ginsenosidivorans]